MARHFCAIPNTPDNANTIQKIRSVHNKMTVAEKQFKLTLWAFEHGENLPGCPELQSFILF